MARISRVVACGYPHHVTQRGVRSIPIFQTDSDRRAYLDFMAVLARAIGEAHRRYTRMKNFSEGVRGYLFQGRFGSCVLDERHLLAAARYVELNPVKAGVVSEAGDYPWSSARFHLGVTSKDALVRDKSLLGLIEDWAEYLQGDDEPRIQATLLHGIRTGRPAGNEGFIEMIERLTGRDLMMRKAGRPLKRVL